MNDIVFADWNPDTQDTKPQALPIWAAAFCVSGAGALLLDGGARPFSAGDTAVAPPNTAHRIWGEPNARIICLHLDQSLIPFREPTVLAGDGTPHLQNVFEAALFHYRSENAYRSLLLEAYGRLISCYLTALRKPSGSSRASELIEREISGKFSDPGFALDAYMKSLPFNYDYLRKLFQKETGVTPLQYLNNLRLQFAAEALKSAHTQGSTMADIARMSGFREPLYFSRMFKKKYGISPSFFRQDQEAEPLSPDPAEDA